MIGLDWIGLGGDGDGKGVGVVYLDLMMIGGLEMTDGEWFGAIDLAQGSWKTGVNVNGRLLKRV